MVRPWESIDLGFTCNNPSPMSYQGSIYVLCNNGVWFIMKADSIQGPWVRMAYIPPPSSHPGENWYGKTSRLRQS